MIKRKELREGNFYRCKLYNGNADVIMQFSFAEQKYIHLFDPIPLTEEWLEAFKFQKANKGAYIADKLPSFRFSPHAAGGYFLNIGKVTAVAYLAYVHQLQNLYLDLCGTELVAGIIPDQKNNIQ